MEKTELFADFVLREAAGRCFILNVGHPQLAYIKPLEINSVGAEIYRLLNEGCSKQSVIDYLCGEYGIDARVAADDLEQFITSLRTYSVPVELIKK